MLVAVVADSRWRPLRFLPKVDSILMPVYSYERPPPCFFLILYIIDIRALLFFCPLST